MKATLRAKLEAQAEKNEIRGQDLLNLIAWAEAIEFHAGMLENIEQGFMEVVGMNGADNPRFSITPAGSKYVEAMPFTGKQS